MKIWESKLELDRSCKERSFIDGSVTSELDVISKNEEMEGSD